MSTARRKEKLKAGLDGLFSKPSVKAPAVQTKVPVVDDPPPPPPVKESPAPVEPVPKPVEKVEPVTAPPEIVFTPAPVEEPAFVEPPAPDILHDDSPPVMDTLPEPQTLPDARPVVKKTNGLSNYGYEFINEEQAVVFTIGDEYYAVGIAVVESIIKMQEITAVPNAPEHVEGVINLRGLVLPVIDLRARLDMPRTPPTKETRIVVVEINDSAVGCIVDAVTEVLRIPESRIEQTSALMLSVDSAFIRGIAKIDSRLIILLDLTKLLLT